MGRFNAPPALRQRILKRYGSQCAACETNGRLVVDVAHLFEDATARHASDDRLIVLCAACNQAEARSSYPRMPSLSERITPGGQAVFAQASYRAGNYARSYGAYRLAAYLYAKGRRDSDAVECLTAALSSARAIRWGDFIAATCRAAKRLCEDGGVAPVQRWMFLDRLALVLFDFLRWEESIDVLEASQRVLASIKEDSRNPQQFEFDKMASNRRASMLGAFGREQRGQRLREMCRQLVADADDLLKVGSHDGFATNLDVASKISAEILGEAAIAHEYGSRVVAVESKVTHKWVLQEIHWRDVRFWHGRGERKHMVDSVSAAVRIFNRHPVILEPVLSESGPRKYSPIAELDDLAIREGELRERDAAPATNEPPEFPFTLRRAEIKEIVEAASDARRHR